MLSIARGVQAVGGGAVVPVSMAIVMANASPERRALGLGAMAAAAEAGGLLGPLWGGGLAELIGWRRIFWINLPICLRSRSRSGASPAALRRRVRATSTSPARRCSASASSA